MRNGTAWSESRVTEVLDVSEWVPADDPEWMGTRWKVWLQDPEVEEMLWLFKAVRCKNLTDGTRRCFEE